MMNFITGVLNLVKGYGTFGVGLSILGLLTWVSVKLFTNHFAHLTKQLDYQGGLMRTLDGKIDTVTERVAKIEGRLQNK